MKTRNADELLAKIRKGATAGFNAKDWGVCLQAIGWRWSEQRHGRETTYCAEAPDGSVFDLKKEPGYRVGNFHEFKPWAKTHGLLAAIEAKLGSAPVKAARADLNNTGTCSCCFGVFKLRRTAKISPSRAPVLHGYSRPGDGYIVGDCLGMGYMPYELSCAGTKAHLAFVNQALKNTQIELAVISTQSSGYERKIKLKEMAKIERQQKLSQDFLAKKIADWRRQPLPGEVAK